MTSALLLIDIQNDFCPGGALAVPEGDAIVPLANQLIEKFDRVVATQDWHPKGHKSFADSHALDPYDVIEMPYGAQVLWPEHCVIGSSGAAFHQDLQIAKAQLILRKGFRREIDSYSAFFENDKTTATGLLGYLREQEISDLVLCGLATDFCVYYSAMDARRLGFDVTLAQDASRAIDLDGSLDRAMADMLGAGVKIENTKDIL